MPDISHEPYWIPIYSTGAYYGTEHHGARRKRKNPIGFAPPAEGASMTPYRERSQAGEYEDKPPAKPKTASKNSWYPGGMR